MLESLKLAGLSLALAAALPAMAAEPPASTDSQVVVKDKATGRLRAATAEEARALRAAGKSAVDADATTTSTGPTLGRAHANGARGVRLNDSLLSYSTLVRQSDGTLAERCIDGETEAQHAVHAAPALKSALPTE